MRTPSSIAASLTADSVVSEFGSVSPPEQPVASGCARHSDPGRPTGVDRVRQALPLSCRSWRLPIPRIFP